MGSWCHISLFQIAGETVPLEEVEYNPNYKTVWEICHVSFQGMRRIQFEALQLKKVVRFLYPLSPKFDLPVSSKRKTLESFQLLIS